MISTTDFGFIHRYESGAPGETRALLLLHGTGGDENDLISLGPILGPGWALLAPRGNVKEGSANRYFRRLAEGVFDVEDLKARAVELADFVVAASARYGIDRSKLVAVGFSNGANIASATLLLRPDAFQDAVLLRPMVPFEPAPPVELTGRRVLAIGGDRDPLAGPAELLRLERLLTGRGASVEATTVAAGHNLTPADIARVREWLATPR